MFTRAMNVGTLSMYSLIMLIIEFGVSTKRNVLCINRVASLIRYIVL